ncbi:MAG TPA: methylenetetrahydrofolate--tRNA-(uracil(54)-C(5))-methyltransferase (FADH(2)-oxidizing) TrmFO [bacterium]|nr:methylenetetrahydrofolate--tRNA-(uracil(54)-C(5))-methyltransferase (FADH(2)-oxidizing) TrmFO [bacterium]HPS30409.1 methylenetetrahydrofolate--tRNA-(uracil(54)-C(5))-methyltransferase (FADH(2)-oxidizing) TrmFO [bacterium]
MKIVILGAGLAGSEAALQLSEKGISIELIDCKPQFLNSEVYSINGPAELVCSNSLKSETPSTSSYLLKEEMRIMGSILLDIANKCSVPAGASLAVNRVDFSTLVAEKLNNGGNISFIKGEKLNSVTELKDKYKADFYIIATGPLTGSEMLCSISENGGSFYDAIAPLVTFESIDMDKCFWGSRYGKGDPDFLNIPMTKEEFTVFYDELIESEKIAWSGVEKPEFFERCMPIEVIASRGFQTLVFGPFRPIGFEFKGKRPFAVIQLRAENSEKSVLNLVGCQTRMKQGEQKRVFRLIPGLENAEFVRYGSVHRNSFLNAPLVLENGVRVKGMDNVYVAGQLSGVEGYNESIFSGMWCAFEIMKKINNLENMSIPPKETMIGGILRKMMTETDNFQPVNANFALLDNPNQLGKKNRKEFYVKDGIKKFKFWYESINSN